jgi:hypothetical protein
MKTLKQLIILSLLLFSTSAFSQLTVEIQYYGSYRVCDTHYSLALKSTIVSGNPTSYTWTCSGATLGSPDSSSTSAQFFSTSWLYLETSDGVNTSKDSFEMIVDASPILNLPTDTQFCRTKGVMVDNIKRFVSGQNTDEVQWFEFHPRASIGTVTSGDVTLNLQNNQADTFVIIANAIGQGACNDVAGAFNIIVNPIPDGWISNSSPNGCNPVTSNFRVSMSNNIDTSTCVFSWSLGDIGNSTSSSSSTSATYEEDGSSNILLVLTTSEGCDTTLTTSLDVYPIPDAMYSVNPNNNAPVILPRFSFSNTSTTPNVLGSVITDIEWTFGDSNGSTSTDMNPTFFYPTDVATYQVILTTITNHGCVNSHSAPVHVGKPGSVSVNDLDVEDNFRVYPNPTTGVLHIASGMEVESCFNTLGQNVSIKKQNEGSYFIESSGIYTLLLKDSKTGNLLYKTVVVE